MILTGLFAGVLAGTIMLLLSHIAPLVGAGNFIRDLDNPHLFGKKFSSREAHFLGILIHLALSAWFGAMYAFLVEVGIYTGYDVLSVLGWGVIISVFMGGVVIPLEGHGIFGVKEDAWFPVDLFLTNIGWALLFCLIIRMWTFVTPL